MAHGAVGPDNRYEADIARHLQAVVQSRTASLPGSSSKSASQTTQPCADSLPGGQAVDAQAEQVVANSATWASVGSGGVIGELNGAVGLLGSNSNGFTPLGLITGSIGPLGCVFGGRGPFGTIDATPAGVGHPLLAGVALPDDPAGNDCGGQISGTDSTQVLATYTSNGNPAVLARSVNDTPDCSGLTAKPDVVWPPNGKFRTTTVSGATDADGDPLTYAITNVMQDEPVSGVGHGSTTPDAQLLSGAEVHVRAERSGTGNGRVYEIAVSVADGEGGTCTGQVTVAVPRDDSSAPAVNDGATYSSL